MLSKPSSKTSPEQRLRQMAEESFLLFLFFPLRNQGLQSPILLLFTSVELFLARRAVRHSPTFSLLTAVDEQNAQTQEQEGFLLSLSASEDGKELRNEDKISLQSSHSSSYGVSKGRSQRKGTAPGLPPCRSCLQITILLFVKVREVLCVLPSKFCFSLIFD